MSMRLGPVNAGLCPKDKGLCGPGWLFPASPESVGLALRLPACSGWEPGHPAPWWREGGSEDVSSSPLVLGTSRPVCSLGLREPVHLKGSFADISRAITKG